MENLTRLHKHFIKRFVVHCQTTFRKHENIDKLTREVLIELVEQIKVHENGSINVRLKFANEYRRSAEYIRLNTHSDAV